MVRLPAALMSIALAGALAACAAPPPPAPAPEAAAPAPAAAPAQASGSLDGVYRGPPGGTHGSSACGTTAFGYPIRVTNGVASMQTVMAGRLEGKVAPDGSLSIVEGRSSLQGKFSGNEFNGTYARGNCGFPLAYKK